MAKAGVDINPDGVAGIGLGLPAISPLKKPLIKSLQTAKVCPSQG